MLRMTHVKARNSVRLHHALLYPQKVSNQLSPAAHAEIALFPWFVRRGHFSATTHSQSPMALGFPPTLENFAHYSALSVR